MTWVIQPTTSRCSRVGNRTAMTGWEATTAGTCTSTPSTSAPPRWIMAARRYQRVSAGTPGSHGGGLHHQRGHHAIHPVLRLRVRQDVAVERPWAGIGGSHQYVPPLTRGDVERIALPGRRLVPPVLGDHGH